MGGGNKDKKVHMYGQTDREPHCEILEKEKGSEVTHIVMENRERVEGREK